MPQAPMIFQGGGSRSPVCQWIIHCIGWCRQGLREQERKRHGVTACYRSFKDSGKQCTCTHSARKVRHLPGVHACARRVEQASMESVQAIGPAPVPSFLQHSMDAACISFQCRRCKYGALGRWNKSWREIGESQHLLKIRRCQHLQGVCARGPC